MEMPKLKQTLEQHLKTLRTAPRSPGATDHVAMSNRIIKMRMLYEAAGRDQPTHTLHGTFTGLNRPMPNEKEAMEALRLQNEAKAAQNPADGDQTAENPGDGAPAAG